MADTAVAGSSAGSTYFKAAVGENGPAADNCNVTADVIDFVYGEISVLSAVSFEL